MTGNQAPQLPMCLIAGSVNTALAASVLTPTINSTKTTAEGVPTLVIRVFMKTFMTMDRESFQDMAGGSIAESLLNTNAGSGSLLELKDKYVGSSYSVSPICHPLRFLILPNLSVFLIAENPDNILFLLMFSNYSAFP